MMLLNFYYRKLHKIRSVVLRFSRLTANLPRWNHSR